jgi:SAM-dependent methyltransferase
VIVCGLNMHQSAHDTGYLFFQTYVHPRTPAVIVEIGSAGPHPVLRSFAPATSKYIGIDMIEDKNVDIVVSDPYTLPFDDNSVDVVVSSSCFEHSEFFWLLFNDIVRVLRPGGIFYLNVPSNGNFHRYPVDCWRFYPDSAKALCNWANRSGHKPIVLESFTTEQTERDIWNDYIAVFLKSVDYLHSYPNRMVHKISNYTNGMIYDSNDILQYHEYSEDVRRIHQGYKSKS